MKKILLIQLYRVGDVLLTTPAARAVKGAFAGSTVDFMAELPAAELLKDNPDLGEALVYDRRKPWAAVREIRRRKYDCVVDFLGTPRSAVLTAFSGAKVRAGRARVFHRWAYNLKLQDPPGPLYAAEEKIRLLSPLGVRFGGDLRAEIRVPDSSRTWAAETVRRISPDRGPLVALSPVSRRAFNRWPLDRYAELADLLIAELGCSILIFWGPGERTAAETVAAKMKRKAELIPETSSLLDCAALLETTDLFVGNDNGVKHVAAAVGVPTFTIYGPHSPVSWTYPDPARHRFVKKNCPCAENSKNERSCQDRLCLMDVSTEEVFRALRPFLADIGTRAAH